MANISKHPEYYNYSFNFPNEDWKVFKNPRSKRKGYNISNYGRIWSMQYGKILRLRTRRHGYFVFAYYNGQSRPLNMSVHRLVTSMFCNNPNNYNEVNHKDGDKQNNYYQNLEWCTHQQNIQHAHDNGLVNNVRGEDVCTAKLTEKDVLTIRATYKPFKYTARMLSIEYDMSLTAIKYILQRKSWKHI